MNRRLANAHYRHHYPIKFPYFSDGADGFCVQTKHLLLLEQIGMTLDIIHNTNNNMTKSSYFCLLETKNLWRGRFTLQERNPYKVTIFKIKSRRKLFFAESSKCSLLLILIDSSTTPSLLFFTSLIHTIVNYVSIYICFHILFFSRIFITSPLDSYVFVSWSLCKSSLHTGSSFHVILKKELFPSLRFLYLGILVTLQE